MFNYKLYMKRTLVNYFRTLIYFIYITILHIIYFIKITKTLKYKTYKWKNKQLMTQKTSYGGFTVFIFQNSLIRVLCELAYQKKVIKIYALLT